MDEARAASDQIVIASLCSPSEHKDRLARYAGRWAYQLAIDTIAYAQNVPVRVLLVKGLLNLPEVIKGVAESADGLAILRAGGVRDDFDRSLLYAPNEWELQSNWVVSLGESNVQVQKEFKRQQAPATDWCKAILLLLPHIERSVWLTDMGNPHPAHALTRMLDHWSLYVLCWCYQQRSQFSDKSRTTINEALGVDGYRLLLGNDFSLSGQRIDSELHHCRLVIGPIWGDQAKTETFERRFFNFVVSAKQISAWRSDLSIKTPLSSEVRDALGSRIGLPESEALLRAESVQAAFVKFFLQVKVHDSLASSMARDDWEQLALLCSWLARWSQALAQRWGLTKRMWVSTMGERGLCVSRLETQEDWALAYCDGRPADSATVADWNKWHEQTRETEWRVDLPSVYWNRAQERQNAAWTAQIVAINNLLQGHADERVGSASAYEDDGNADKLEAANHLLRGYGGRVCHHLLSLTRADVADLYWCDYAQDPMRLVHVGGYMRLQVHRAHREDIHQSFDRAVWRPRPKGDFVATERPQADRQNLSESQAYRVASSGAEDSPTNAEPVRALFDAFELGGHIPKPQSAIAFPLLVNQRVVGVLTFAGLSPRQFSRRLSAPLHRAAHLIGQAMYGASLLWQLRQITYFFTSTPFESLKKYDETNEYNPLKAVSRCLANVFLCRGVHIWLKDSLFPTRYRLYGNNLNTDDLESPTELRLAAAVTGSQGAFKNDGGNYSTPFLTFAKDLCEPDAPAPVYAMPQGRLKDGESAGNRYSLNDALRGLLLPERFAPVNDPTSNEEFVHQSKLRTRIFRQYGLYDLATFALVQESPGHPPSWVGGVTLHDLPTALLSDPDHPQPWPDSWQAVTAHVQKFLPNLLSQVEILQRPLDDMRRFLLHEGRAELGFVQRRIDTLVKGGVGVLSPDGLLRRNLRGWLQHSLNPHDDARLIDKQLDSLREAIADLNNPKTQYRLDALVRAIDMQRDLSELGEDLYSAEDFVDVQASIWDLIEPHESQLRARGVHASIEGFKRPVKLWIHVLLWERIVSNLVDNASKYAQESFEVRWLPESRTVRFSNVAFFDAEWDTSDKLFVRGVRGSAAQGTREAVRGQGYGLWGAKLMCDLVGLELTFSAHPQGARMVKNSEGQSVRLARYYFDLRLPGGGRMA
jgi:hypothetical protein